VAISVRRNITQKEAENETRYKILCRFATSVEREMCDYTGNNLKKSIVATTGKHSADSLQKTAVLVT
jgi:hypothetical protein